MEQGKTQDADWVWKIHCEPSSKLAFHFLKNPTAEEILQAFLFFIEDESNKKNCRITRIKMASTNYWYSMKYLNSDYTVTFYMQLSSLITYVQVPPEEFKTLTPKETFLTSSQILVREIGKALIKKDRLCLRRLGVKEEFFEWLKQR